MPPIGLCPQLVSLTIPTAATRDNGDDVRLESRHCPQAELKPAQNSGKAGQLVLLLPCLALSLFIDVVYHVPGLGY